MVAVGAPHHITQRGNNQQDVFLFDDDRRRYLDTLRRECARRDVALLGYCLMSNHVHLVAVPNRADGLAKALGQTHQLHAQWFNRRYQRNGHLWQNRFYSCALGRSHLRLALSYVDLNPVRAGMVPEASGYPWSSARAHIEGHDEGGLLEMSLWREVCPLADWADVLRQREGEDSPGKLREATKTGRPWGDEKFIEDLEKRVGRKLGAGTPGRPRKQRARAAAASPK